MSLHVWKPQDANLHLDTGIQVIDLSAVLLRTADFTCLDEVAAFTAK